MAGRAKKVETSGSSLTAAEKEPRAGGKTPPKADKVRPNNNDEAQPKARKAPRKDDELQPKTDKALTKDERARPKAGRAPLKDDKAQIRVGNVLSKDTADEAPLQSVKASTVQKSLMFEKSTTSLKPTTSSDEQLMTQKITTSVKPETTGKPSKPFENSVIGELKKLSAQVTERRVPTKKQNHTPPSKYMAGALKFLPFTDGGCLVDTLPFFASILLIATSGILFSLLHVSVIVAFYVTYSEKMYDPAEGICVNDWWENNNLFFYVLRSPTIVRLTHLALLLTITGFSVMLFVATLKRSASLIRINVLAGVVILPLSATLAVVEILLEPNHEWLHWQFVTLAIFVLAFLYGIAIINGYQRHLMNPLPKDNRELG